jgi:hypothetical protein
MLLSPDMASKDADHSIAALLTPSMDVASIDMALSLLTIRVNDNVFLKTRMR